MKKRDQDQRSVAPNRHSAPGEPATGNLTPVQLVALTAVAIFAAELLIMFLLPLLPPIPVAYEAFLDSLLLTILATPILYSLLFRPLVLHINERDMAENALRELNQSLEERVQLRTEDLARTNKALQLEVNERKTTEDRIRRTNRFVQRLIESAPCIMATVSINSLKSNYVNGRVEDFLGISPDQVAASQGALLDTILTDASMEEIRTMFQELALAPHGEISRRQIELRAADGTLRPFRLGVVVASRTAIGEAEEVLLVATPVDECA